jgi:hypothetical protein
MIKGLIAAIACFIVSEDVLFSVIAFYLCTGIAKAFRWKSMRAFDVPPLVCGSFIKGVFLWPIITVSNAIYTISTWINRNI